jgi:hypothetical protein
MKHLSAALYISQHRLLGTGNYEQNSTCNQVESTVNNAVKDILNIWKTSRYGWEKSRAVSSKPVHRRRLESLPPAEAAGGLLFKNVCSTNAVFLWKD